MAQPTLSISARNAADTTNRGGLATIADPDQVQACPNGRAVGQGFPDLSTITVRQVRLESPTCGRERKEVSKWDGVVNGRMINRLLAMLRKIFSSSRRAESVPPFCQVALFS